MAKALTEHEKKINENKIKKVTKNLIEMYGFKRITVDQITKAASISKGAFYLYFNSKEDLLFDLIVEIHESSFEQAFLFFEQSPHIPLEQSIPKFIFEMLNSKDHMILLRNGEDIQEILNLYFSTHKNRYIDLEAYEIDSYKKLLLMMNIDVQIVKPEVVSNLIHSIYASSNYLKDIDAKYMDQTIVVMIDSIVNYIKKGVK
jgi:AcrR family transcriptional regulator